MQSQAGQGLDQTALRPFAVLAIAIAAISPTTSVFLVYGADLATAGTGIVWAFLIGALIAGSMAFCYAEVGSVFPSAGGTYTVVRRALGPMWGGVVNILFLVLGLTASSSILLAAATYLSSLVPGGLPANWVAFAMMVAVTALSIGRISPAGWVATAMLALELAVILAFIGFCFASPSLATNPFTHPVLAANAHGNALQSVGAGAMLAAVVPALFAFNGYDWPLYFAEETPAARRALPRAVLVAAGVSIAVEVLAVIAATFAIHNLSVTASSSAPLTAIATQTMGSTGAKILIAGVVVAMFDTGLAGNLGYARIFYAAGKDRMWPGPLNGFFARVGRSKVPVGGFAVLFVGNSLLCIFSTLQNLITFTGVVIVIVYLLVAASALTSRVRDRGLRRTLRMPAWPLFPVIALAGGVAALTQQTAKDIAIAVGLSLAAAIVYLVVRSRLPGRLERSPSDTGPSWESIEEPLRP